MTLAFPGESAEYRAARDQLLEQEIELPRVTEAVAASRRALPPGGPVPEDYVFQSAGADSAPTDVKLSELFEPGKNSLVIYNFMFPRDPGDASPGPAIGKTALLSLEEARALHAPRCSTSSRVPPSTLDSTSTSLSSRRRRSHARSPSPESAAGVAYVSCPRPPTLTTATTTEKPPTDSNGRCLTCSAATRTQSATSGPRSSSTPQRTAISTRATSDHRAALESLRPHS